MYKYSKLTNSFYPNNLIDSYSELPQDLVTVTEDIFNEFISQPPKNKIRGADEYGFPAWVDIPAASQEELINIAERKKTREIVEASQIIATLQDAVDLEMATVEEVDALTEWKKYRILVSRIDTSKAPDIQWPTFP